MSNLYDSLMEIVIEENVTDEYKYKRQLLREGQEEKEFLKDLDRNIKRYIKSELPEIKMGAVVGGTNGWSGNREFKNRETDTVIVQFSKFDTIGKQIAGGALIGSVIAIAMDTSALSKLRDNLKLNDLEKYLNKIYKGKYKISVNGWQNNQAIKLTCKKV